jgi:plastocyanin
VAGDRERKQDGRGKRRGGRIAAIVGGCLLFLGTAGAVTDMIIQSADTVRDELHSAGPVRLQARNFAFVPRSVVLRGQRSVTVIVTNDGVSQHSFTMDRLGIDVVVQPGQSATVDVSPPRPGVYPFYCRFHEAYDMRGAIRFEASRAGS